MKIYIASSWKNSDILLSLADHLREMGHKVDCFCDGSSGRYVFDYREIGNAEDLDAVSFLQDHRSQRTFQEDKKWLDWAEAVVMVLPCGNSAHLEAGYAKGQGKKLIILGEFEKGKFDVMYGFADALIPWSEMENLL